MKPFAHLCFISILIVACSTKKQETNSKKNQPTNPPPTETRSFDYKPLKPLNGELKAVIEIGSLGLNYFIIEIDDNGRWDAVKSIYGRSNLIYGVSSKDEILATINKFKKEIQLLGVKSKNIHLIASSSVGKIEDIAQLQKETSKTGLRLIPIDAQREAQLALIATIPKEFIKESFLVDIGSGNTKISWVEGKDTLSTEIHGSKYFLGDVQDTTVFREVRDAVLEVPLKNRNLCFILGGMIYELAKSEIKEDERYVVLGPPPSYPTSNERLKAANVIYSALYLEPTFSYIFDSKSNFPIGYLINLDNK